MTQVEAARLAGVSRRYYADLENNQANVSVEVLTRVADALGITELYFGDIRAAYGDASRQSLLERVERARRLLAEVGAALSVSEGLVGDLEAVAGAGPQPSPFVFAGAVTEDDRGARTVASMPAARLLVAEELFRAVDFSYPVPLGGAILRAEVLGESMEPELRPGDAIHIDTSIRSVHPGVLLAVHSASSGSVLGRVPETGERILLRMHSEPVLLGTGACVILGAVEKAA